MTSARIRGLAAVLLLSAPGPARGDARIIKLSDLLRARVVGVARLARLYGCPP